MYRSAWVCERLLLVLTMATFRLYRFAAWFNIEPVSL